MVSLGARTGLRPDEAARLEYRDVKIVDDAGSGERILEIEVRGKRGTGYCKSTRGAVRPFERMLARTSAKLSLAPLQRAIGTNRQKLEAAWQRAGRATGRLLERRYDHLTSCDKLFVSLSYKSILRRGFALVRDGKGGPVRAKSEVAPGQAITVEFADGLINVRESGAPRQASLF